MVEPTRRRSSRGQGEDLESKRHRMRVAQRKHRARKEQNIGQLEDEVSALRLQLSEAKEGLRRLEDALHLADEEGDVLDDHDVDAALTSLRRTLGGSEVSEDVQSEQWPENIANEAPAKSRSLQDPRQPGPFGALLYAYCIKLGHRILSNSDKPSIRLGQRLFHAWLRQMEEPLDEMAKLRFVRERLGMREARLGLVSDSRDREKTWRILKKPRLPGYEHYFDVAQVEVYLVRQGFVFSKDLTTVRLPQKTQRESHIVPDAFDAEPMSVDPEPDDWMQHDMLFTDEWVENARNFIMQDFGADTESWAFGDLDARCSEPEGRHDTDDLPFGLREQSSEEPLPACGVQLDPAVCGGEFCGVDPDDDGSYESDEQDHSGLEAASEVSVAALVRRLAVICICVGEAGPGFAPEDVDKVIMDLSDPD